MLKALLIHKIVTVLYIQNAEQYRNIFQFLKSI